MQAQRENIREDHFYFTNYTISISHGSLDKTGKLEPIEKIMLSVISYG